MSRRTVVFDLPPEDPDMPYGAEIDCAIADGSEVIIDRPPWTRHIVVPVSDEMYDELCAGIDVAHIQLVDRGDGLHDLVCTSPPRPIPGISRPVSVPAVAGSGGTP